jgi:hypothetical protein
MEASVPVWVTLPGTQANKNSPGWAIIVVHSLMTVLLPSDKNEPSWHLEETYWLTDGRVHRTEALLLLTVLLNPLQDTL